MGKLKKTILLQVILLISIHSAAQINFEKGYFIDTDDRKIECFIKNADWKDNPGKFTYKREESGAPEVGDAQSVKEFGIYGASTYVSRGVLIDRSGNDINRLNNNKEPVWTRERLFLKRLIYGKASLLYYGEGTLTRFFFTTPVADTISQLVFKAYSVGISVAYNNRFRQQLWLEARCENATMSSMERLRYTQDDLEKYFISYNRCLGDTIIQATTAKTKHAGIYNLKIVAGVNASSLTIKNPIWSSRDVTFDKTYSFRLGIESELILPFKKNKWSIVIEPTFNQVKSSKEYSNGIATLDFKNIEFPIGLRYYFFLNDRSKIFLDALYVLGYSPDFHSTLYIDNTTLQTNAGDCYALGGGFEYDRLSLAMRYYSGRDLLKDYISWPSNYGRLSFLIGYKIIKAKTAN